MVSGEVQLANVPASISHSSVEPASVEVNENVGVESVVVPVGPDVMVVSGAVVSTVKARLAGEASTLPAASIARTSNVCGPSLSADVVNGVVQAAKVPASTRHWKVESAWLEVKENVGVLSFVGPDGPAVIVVSGGVVSTVNVRWRASGRCCRRRRWLAPRRCESRRSGWSW